MKSKGEIERITVGVDEAAVKAGHLPGPLSEFYQRVQRRHGKQTAAIALARKLLVIAYFVLKREHPYDEERG